MIREFLGPEGHITCLVPYYAFSAGTLIAVGANEIFMHPSSSLGPVDPQIMVQSQGSAQQFAYEDLAAYTNFLKEEGGLTEQTEKSELLKPLVGEIKPSVIGAAKRSSMQSIVMAEKLLKLHMTGVEAQKAEIIAEKLSRSYFSHGHAVSKREAIDLGLKIADADTVLEDYIWSVFEDFEKEMKMNEPFDPRSEYLRDPRSAVLLSPPPVVNLPANMPPQVAQQAWQQVLSNISSQQGPVLDIELIQAAVESVRLSSRFVTKAKLLGARQADMNFAVGMPRLYAQWERY